MQRGQGVGIRPIHTEFLASLLPNGRCAGGDFQLSLRSHSKWPKCVELHRDGKALEPHIPPADGETALPEIALCLWAGRRRGALGITSSEGSRPTQRVGMERVLRS